MTPDPEMERFFQQLKSATSGSDESAPAATPKRLVILPEAIGEIVARLSSLGRDEGEFRQAPSGEIYFYYRDDRDRRWYVNKSMSGFCEAAAIFNKFCALHADDDDTDNEAAWTALVAQLRSQLEKIEPLGDPEAALWSATIHDTDGGLLTLY